MILAAVEPYGTALFLLVVGVAMTAGLLALFVRMLGLGWIESLLLGAVVSSTDAAAVLAVLRGGRLHLQPRVGNTLEVESCVNDPMAMILTVIMIEVAKSPHALRWTLALGVPLQLAIGAGVGALVGYPPLRDRAGNLPVGVRCRLRGCYAAFGAGLGATGSFLHNSGQRRGCRAPTRRSQ